MPSRVTGSSVDVVFPVCGHRGERCGGGVDLISGDGGGRAPRVKGVVLPTRGSVARIRKVMVSERHHRRVRQSQARTTGGTTTSIAGTTHRVPSTHPGVPRGDGVSRSSRPLRGIFRDVFSVIRDVCLSGVSSSGGTSIHGSGDVVRGGTHRGVHGSSHGSDGRLGGTVSQMVQRGLEETGEVSGVSPTRGGGGGVSG